MMELIIDLGNTNQKLAVFKDDKILDLLQFPALGPRIIQKVIKSYSGIGHCILSSVVTTPPVLLNFLSSNFRFIILDETTPVPISNLYRSKPTLGKDRLAAAVAGHHRFPGEHVLVINAGTCITFDFVNAAGEYLGGAISPGIAMRFKALHTFTRKLPLIAFRETDILTGTDTGESILSGVLNGVVAEIEGVAQKYSAKYPELKTILSGGDMNYFDNRLKISTFAVPNIVIHGLQQILAFNVIQTR